MSKYEDKHRIITPVVIILKHTTVKFLDNL